MNTNTKKKILPNYGKVVIALLIFCFGFAISRAYSIVSMPQEVTEQEESLELFWRVWNTLEGKYPFEEPTTDKKFYGAIEGLAQSYGDDYTTFLPPQKATFFSENVSGEFGGIGAEVNIIQGMLVIVAPLKDSPAQKSGLLPGDVISKVDAAEVVGNTLTQATSLIRGEVGTDVVLSILRRGEEKEIEIMVTRDIVTVPIIETEIVDDTFVISLFNFNEMSRKEFKKAITEFKNSRLDKLVLDLRNNPGGFLDAANDIASYFLPQGKTIVSETFGNSGQKEETFRSTGHSLLNGNRFKMAILVDSGSASASEIVAGAMKDYDRAVIVGTSEQTHGKGTVQAILDLKNFVNPFVGQMLGPIGAMKITTDMFYRINGMSTQFKGIHPHIVLPDEYGFLDSGERSRIGGTSTSARPTASSNFRSSSIISEQRTLPVV